MKLFINWLKSLFYRLKRQSNDVLLAVDGDVNKLSRNLWTNIFRTDENWRIYEVFNANSIIKC